MSNDLKNKLIDDINKKIKESENRYIEQYNKECLLSLKNDNILDRYFELPKDLSTLSLDELNELYSKVDNYSVNNIARQYIKDEITSVLKEGYLKDVLYSEQPIMGIKLLERYSNSESNTATISEFIDLAIALLGGDVICMEGFLETLIKYGISEDTAKDSINVDYMIYKLLFVLKYELIQFMR